MPGHARIYKAKRGIERDNNTGLRGGYLQRGFAGLKRPTSERNLRHTEERDKKDGEIGSAAAGQKLPALVIRTTQSTENFLVHIFPHHKNVERG